MIRKTAALICALAAPLAANADQLTFNIGAGTLSNGSGNPMPTGLLQLVASTTDRIFNGPTAGSFVTGDDQVLFQWNIEEFPADSPHDQSGNFQGATTPLTRENFPNLTSGDPLRLFWYPTLSTSDSSPSAGTAYGSGPLDFPAEWDTPNSGTVSLQFLTVSAGGTRPDEEGYATLTVVPEPSQYAAIFGAVCIGAGLVRRKLRKHA